MGDDWSVINDTQSHWHDSLSTLTDVEVLSASSLWIKPEVTLTDTFTSLAALYRTENHNLTDDADRSASQVAAWVSNNTNGMINYTPELTNVDLLLLDALYFRGQWLHQFSPSNTQDAPFTATDGSIETVPMMRLDLSEEVPYHQSALGQVLLLPYGRFGKAHMKLLLPPEGVSLQETLNSLTPEILAQYGPGNKNLRGQGTVEIPRFRLKGELDLLDESDPLEMRDDFTGADFTPISPQMNAGELMRLRHIAVMEIDEVGTEAAALTDAYMSASFSDKKFHFRADRPFLLFIEDYNGVILFAAAVNTTKAPSSSSNP